LIYAIPLLEMFRALAYEAAVIAHVQAQLRRQIQRALVRNGLIGKVDRDEVMS
jgi:hypothetical protein